MSIDASYFKNQIANEEWIELRKQLGLRYCNNIKTCENFLEQYFVEMQRLIDEIKNNPYENKEDESKLKSDLYELDGMFVLYKYNMRYYFDYINTKFNLYNTENQISYPYVHISFFHSHSFNKYLSWKNYFSPALFEGYYLKVVDAIEEFVQSRGEKLPKYLYNLREGEFGYFFVEKYEYFDWKDIPHERGANLSLPNYHQISGFHGKLEDYEKLYYRWFSRKKDFEECFNRFIETEWPIRQWITENRPFAPCDTIKKEDCVKPWEEQTLEER